MTIHQMNSKPGPNGPEQTETISLTPDDVKEMACCPECFNECFVQGQKFALISKLNPKNNTGEDMYVPVPVWICSKCGSELKKD